MSTLYQAGDVVRPRSAHDPALRDVIADVLAVEVARDCRGRGREVSRCGCAALVPSSC